MTKQQFDALLTRRDELQAAHERACLILEEEGSRYAQPNRKKCARLYDELAQVQTEIDAEIAAERAAENGAA
jgi:hypothetical protein